LSACLDAEPQCASSCYSFVMGIGIPADVIREMLAHAREEAPRECCGLLVGKGESVVRSVRARNLDAKATRYLIDPEDHFAAIRGARAEGLEVVGAYHSHPSSTPVPSATDIAEANSGSDFLYVIVSLVNEDVRAYRIDAGVCMPLALSPQP
jgi:[CysO sulfur-carrier protein]-S-L-cysteine hydrolase